MKVCTWVYSCTADTIRAKVCTLQSFCTSKSVCQKSANVHPGIYVGQILRRKPLNLHALFFIRHPRPPHLFIYTFNTRTCSESFVLRRNWAVPRAFATIVVGIRRPPIAGRGRSVVCFRERANLLLSTCDGHRPR